MRFLKPFVIVLMAVFLLATPTYSHGPLPPPDTPTCDQCPATCEWWDVMCWLCKALCIPVPPPPQSESAMSILNFKPTSCPVPFVAPAKQEEQKSKPKA